MWEIGLRTPRIDAPGRACLELRSAVICQSVTRCSSLAVHTPRNVESGAQHASIREMNCFARNAYLRVCAPSRSAARAEQASIPRILQVYAAALARIPAHDAAIIWGEGFHRPRGNVLRTVEFDGRSSKFPLRCRQLRPSAAWRGTRGYPGKQGWRIS